MSGKIFKYGIAEIFAFLWQILLHWLCIYPEWTNHNVARNGGLNDVLLLQVHLYFLLHFQSSVFLCLIVPEKKSKLQHHIILNSHTFQDKTIFPQWFHASALELEPCYVTLHHSTSSWLSLLTVTKFNTFSCLFLNRLFLILPDILVDIQVHDLQIFLVLSGVGFHWNESFSDRLADVFTQLFNVRLMFTNRFKQWCSRPENVLKDIL